MIVVPMGFARGSYQTGVMAALRDVVSGGATGHRPAASGRVRQLVRRFAEKRPLSRSEVAYRVWQENARAR